MNDWEWHLLEDAHPLDGVASPCGVEVRKGDRVRLRPVRRADILDAVFAGKLAVVERIEQDYEGKIQVAVVLEDDPGKDLGMMRQPGHCFFFSPDEIEAL
jgi:hypothetical protein